MIKKCELESFLRNNSIPKAATHFGVNARTIGRWMSSFGLSRHALRFGQSNALTSDQENIINGCLLGDGCIEKVGNNGARLSIAQSSGRLGYLYALHDSFMPFSKNISHHIKNNADCFYTSSHPVFKLLRDKWYRPDGCGVGQGRRGDKKTVPADIILNTEVLAHWYMQDGYNHAKYKTIILCTDCFANDEVDMLIAKLKYYCDLFAYRIKTNKGYPRIRISNQYYFEFIEKIGCLIHDCFLYKKDISKAPQTKPGMFKNKLLGKSAEIKELYNEGHRVTDLALKFGVSRQSIWRATKI